MALNQFGIVQVYVETPEWVNAFLRSRNERINVIEIKPYFFDSVEKLVVLYTEKEEQNE